MRVKRLLVWPVRPSAKKLTVVSSSVLVGLMLALLMAALGVVPMAVAAPVFNGDFEAGEAGWTRWQSSWGAPGGWDASGGTGNLTAAASGNFGWYQRVSVVPNVPYTLVGEWTGDVGGSGWTEILMFDCTEGMSEGDIVTHIDGGGWDDIVVKKDSWGLNPPTAWPWEDIALSAVNSLDIQTSCSQVVIGLKLGSGSGGAWESFDNLELVTDPFAVTGVEPAPNSHTATASTAVTVSLSVPFSQTTVTTRTLFVHGGFHGHLDGDLSLGTISIVFGPADGLHPGELVQTSVTTGVEWLGGEPLIGPYVWQFRTAVGGGSGDFADSGQSLGSSDTVEIKLGDLDGDGDLDAFVANFGNLANRVWVNDGTGAFADSGQSPGGSLTYGVALGDLDGDGDLDAFAANYVGQADRVWLNDGTGTFTDSGQSLGHSDSFGVALGDLDGDGDLDAFVVDGAQPDRVWLNDGAGSFTDSGQALGSSRGLRVALGDLDGDGDLDAFVANIGDQPNRVWLNDGTGTFADTGQSLGGSSTHGLALGDLDGDGDLDAFAANIGNQANRVWLNDGAGTFTDSGQALGGADSRGVALGDVDGDGDLDAFAANYGFGSGYADRVWVNDGTGIFADPGQSVGSSDSHTVALGDLDGDGDLDAFVGNYLSQGNRVWLNRDLADLSIAKTVTPPVVAPGQAVTYTLAYTNHGPGVASGVLISDVVPGELTDLDYAYAGAEVSSIGSTDYTWQVADLAPDEGGRITITGVVDLSVSGTFSLTNQALITSALVDWNVGDNTPQVSNTVDAESPVPPDLTGPVDGTLTDTNSLTLGWGASLDAAGYLLDWNGTVLDVGDVTGHATGVLTDGVYTWTVAAYDRVGNTSVYTDVWSFTVDTTPPDPPALASPADGAETNDSTPTLAWEASSSADVAGYLLDLDGAVVAVGDVTEHTTAVLTDGVYIWTVAAYDGVGNTSAYTDVWSFTVDTIPPGSPVLSSPGDGAETNDSTPILAWGASADAAGYLLDLDGAVLDVGDATQHTTDVLADGTYTWTVAAYDAAGNASAYADAWSFTVEATPPQILATAPGAGEMDVAIDAAVVITFSEPIAAGTFAYTVTPDPGGWSALWSDGGSVVTLDQASFVPQTAYTVTITAADDLAGNPLAGAPYAWSFSTLRHRVYLPLVAREYP